MSILIIKSIFATVVVEGSELSRFYFVQNLHFDLYLLILLTLGAQFM